MLFARALKFYFCIARLTLYPWLLKRSEIRSVRFMPDRNACELRSGVLSSGYLKSVTRDNKTEPWLALESYDTKLQRKSPRDLISAPFLFVLLPRSTSTPIVYFAPS